MQIRKVVVHCSDSPDNVDIGVAEIRVWHTAPKPQGRGWKDVGYHYVVRRSGKVEVGRFENGDSVLEGREIGAHVKGHNSDALGVCWVGKTKPTDAQRHALVALLKGLCLAHGLEAKDVFGHCELDAGKTCPNLDMRALRVEVELELAA